MVFGVHYKGSSRYFRFLGWLGMGLVIMGVSYGES